MAIWIPPAKWQRKTQEAFELNSNKYIAENGYTIRVPGFRDIVIVNVIEPMTEEENKAWRRKDKAFFSPRRYEDILAEKKRRKDRYMAILSSPTPQFFKSRAEIATAIDNVQDATSTFAWLAQIGLKAMPKFIAKAGVGPIGWMLFASDLMNLSRSVISPEMRGLRTKRHIEKTKRLNHTSTTMKGKLGDFWTKSKMTRIRAIEGFQVTNDLFGFGLALGSILAFPIDLIFGAKAFVAGQEVKFQLPVPRLHFYELLSMKAIKGVYTMLSSPLQFTQEETLTSLTTLFTATNILKASKWLWNVFDHTSNPAKALVSGKHLQNTLTTEVIDEVHKTSRTKPDFLQPDQNRVPLQDVIMGNSEAITNNINRFMANNRFNDNGFYISQLITLNTLQAIESISDDGEVEIDTRPSVKFCMEMLHRDIGIAEMNPGFLPRSVLNSIKALDTDLEIFNYREALSIVSSSSRNALIPYEIKTHKDYSVYDAVTLIGRENTLKIKDTQDAINRVDAKMRAMPDFRSMSVVEFRRREKELQPPRSDIDYISEAGFQGVMVNSIERSSVSSINKLAALQEKFPT